MTDMSIAHFGTTLAETPPAEDEDQNATSMSGDLKRTDEFLKILGAEVYITNLYPFGRQFIYKRGKPTDPDYFEKDTFTSYTAAPMPKTKTPRIGETIFRLPHRNAPKVAALLNDKGLIEPLSDYNAFINEVSHTLFFIGPDKQRYELTQSSDAQHINHRVYVWTDESDLDDHKDGYAESFDLQFQGTEDFYNFGTAHLLVRQNPGVTIALLTTKNGTLSPKNSFDIFGDAGYSHFRLSAPNKSRALNNSVEAFPDGGGPVAYVHFQNSYLELVQFGSEL